MIELISGGRHLERGELCMTDLQIILKGWENRLSVHNLEGDQVRHTLVPVESSGGFVLDLEGNGYFISIRREVSERGCHFICFTIRINCYKWRQWRCRDNSIGNHPWVLDQSIDREFIIALLFRLNGHRWKVRAAKAWVGVRCWRGCCKDPFSLFFYFRNDYTLRWLHHRECNRYAVTPEDQKKCEETGWVVKEFNPRKMRSITY